MMLDEFDYKEPVCPLKGGKDFYYPEKDSPLGRIPVDRIIRRVDSFFDRNEYAEAGRLLVYWKDEAVALKDLRGELAMQSELVGFYRKQGDQEKGLAAVRRALALTDTLEQGELASGGTVFINCATACQAFGMAEEALPLYRRAEEIYKKTLPATDARFGGLYNNMALALVELGQTDAAETAYRSALDVMSQASRGEAESAITWINLAYLYESDGRDEQIPACMQKALALLRSPNLPHDGYYAFVLEKCAPAFEDFGDTQTCEMLKKESEAIYARS